MKKFLDGEFLLENETARRLYHSFAADLPVIDYRSHVDPRDIYEDKHFENITQAWLANDTAKWRLMRNNGVDERYITGRGTDREKFQAFAQTLPKAIGNPLYLRCHMELKKYFGYDGVLSGDTAQEIWDLCEEKLKAPDMGTRGLLRKGGVTFIGTTDDPCSDLAWHEKLAADADFPVRVSPIFQPDPALNIDRPEFREYVAELEQAAGVSITSAPEMCRALTLRMVYFQARGCRIGNLGLDGVTLREISEDQATNILKKVLKGGTPTQEEAEGWRTSLLYHCAWEYHKYGWTMQLHFGRLRDPNSRALTRKGSNAGFDCIDADSSKGAVYEFLDALERLGHLPKTILYSLDPTDNAWLDSLLGAFQGPMVPGKIQHGAPWWFNNSKRGIQDHLTSLATMSVLGNFVGMFTDASSFLVHSQHDYFRRIFCNLLGSWVENGEYPDDEAALREIVEGVCCKNAQRFFEIQ